MLQLAHITKSYTTAGFEQKALDDLSVVFRDNEFAAILGPSGSGKTTLLNVIGGLDRADTGELVIDGTSTKLYKDRDWDTYRNNRIGFVFQSYNLIPHQTVLANVELALTLSGVSKSERRKRAQAMLNEVGLGRHMGKKPSQLSGGQMQRVAIARALINDPEILLADEPTGALDSKTSVQIMELLTKVADKRLVIMVTHNPELAATYANRTINLSDGHIVSDSNPYVPTVSALAAAPRVPKRASMGFFTSIALSFSNLMTKKGRTAMTAVAGSIGIIGIAAILALANGMNSYIKDVEQSTLSQYPLTINKTGIDLMAMMAASSGAAEESVGNDGSNSANGDAADGNLRVTSILTKAFTSISANDLSALKVFLDDDSQSHVQQYVNAIEYKYDITPQIYLGDTSQKAYQANPDPMSKMMSGGTRAGGGGSGSGMSSAMTLGMSSGVFNQLPRDRSLVEPQYDVLAGRWPQAYNECLLVLGPNDIISDYLLYVLGLKDPAEMEKMLDDFQQQKSVTPPAETVNFSYQDVLDVDLRLVPSVDYYTYDSTYKMYVSHQNDKKYMRNLVSKAEKIRIVGVVGSSSSSTLSPLRPGVNYTPELIDYLMQRAADSDIVKAQIKYPNKDVFTNKTFDVLNKEGNNDFDMSKMLSIDPDGIKKAFKFDASALSKIDFSNLINPQELMASMPTMPTLNISSLLSSITMNDLPLAGLGKFANTVLNYYLSDNMPGYETKAKKINEDFQAYLKKPKTQSELASAASAILDIPGANALAQDVMVDYLQYCGSQGIIDPNDMIAAFPGWLAKPQVSANITNRLQGLIDQEALATASAKVISDFLKAEGISTDSLTNGLASDLNKWLKKPAVQKKLQTAFSKNVDLKPLTKKIGTSLNTYLKKSMGSYMTKFMAALQKQLEKGMGAAMAQLGKSMSSIMHIDSKALADAFHFNLSEDELTQLMLTLMGNDQKSYDGNMKDLGYASWGSPSGISIYPKDFESKQQVLNILDSYNQRMRDSDQEEKVITYTDIVGALMSSVTDIINIISMVLMAFVGISLVVSSIMIGIVTYVSVLERKKEIGILRSIGASKRNVGNVFNAETLIIGFAAGVIGILFTALACIPANILIEQGFDVANIVRLPLLPSLGLIAISCLLSLVAGLIPSMAASRRDPVEALRSE
ncbi:MAG: ABC transporter ATP-binding protein/permease [Actinomycetia bacterium]|nr:ABC transporter ATP-binding protein/permease [Actinomycetes bacterium]